MPSCAIVDTTLLIGFILHVHADYSIFTSIITLFANVRKEKKHANNHTQQNTDRRA